MRLLEIVLFRLAVWFGLPLMLLVLAIGPARVWKGVRRAWKWLWNRRLEPEVLLTEVVRQQQQHVVALRKVLEQFEAAEADLIGNLQKSKKNIASLEEEARRLASRNDDLGARAALYKVGLERAAVANFEEQLRAQREHIGESRQRLYLLELQLRQYEVGRSILLTQLAEARTVEQQFAIAREFDPFSAIADWKKAEGIVQEKTLSARAVERVYNDLNDMSQPAAQGQVENNQDLEAQLAALKARVRKTDPLQN